MPERTFYLEESRHAATAAVKAIEAQTSAEIVIALRHSSGHYRAADYLAGSALALVSMVAVMLAPVSFHVWAVVVNVLFAFGVGVLVSSALPSLRRMLTRQKRRHEAVRAGARSVFVDLGVSRTSGRWGVLVYLSMLEREVEVLPDIGIDLNALGEEWTRAVSSMQGAMARLDFAAFHAALLTLGPVLGKHYPHRDDDVNELPDEVSAS